MLLSSSNELKVTRAEYQIDHSKLVDHFKLIYQQILIKQNYELKYKMHSLGRDSIHVPWAKLTMRYMQSTTKKTS